MNFSPPRQYRRRPFALVTPGRRTMLVETVDGKGYVEGRRDIERVLERLKGHAVYAHAGLSSLAHTTGATSWVLSTWRGRETRMTHLPSGVAVTSLRGSLAAEPDPFAALAECLAWLGGFGVAAASVTQMAWRLLECSLPGEVGVAFDPELGRRAFFGPRQEVRLREDAFGHVHPYRHQRLIDVKAAYPTAMAARPIATGLREVGKATALDPTEPGIAMASVLVPQDHPHPPLPVRLARDAIQFQTGRIEGTWTWCELAAAQALGCDVEVTRSFAPRRTFPLFERWWEMARTGRDLRTGTALAKAIAVCAWGPFAMDGEERSEVHYADDAGEHAYEVPLPERRLPHRWAVHVAAEVTSRVRVQVLTEALGVLASDPVHVDTDGVIVRRSAGMPANSGDGFGQWRVKHEMAIVEVIAPQVYRWVHAGSSCRECTAKARYHYVASGMTAEAAQRLFEHHGHATRISYLAREDAVLPSCSSFDQHRIDQLLAEAQLYGRGR